VEVEDVPMRLPVFKKQKVVPASSVAMKKKDTHSSSVVGPSSSSPVVRPVVTKLEEARRRRRVEKELVTVMLEVDMSSDSESVVGKCRHCFDANGKTCLH
jgi:hypothetical protein